MKFTASMDFSCFIFFFFWLHYVTYGILVPQPEIKPVPSLYIGSMKS